MQQHSDQHISGGVLLADRHQNMLEGIRSLLETVFDVVVMVADEKSLLDSMVKIRPILVVVDLSLPIIEGINVVRNIKRVDPEMKVLILSVHDEETAIDDSLSAGAAGFVLKRTAVNDLIPAVYEVLEGRTYVSPSVRLKM